MDSKNVIGGGGIKVTYIETQFVTSDAAGFKDLVQRLTGRSAPLPPAAAPAPHRPRPCRPDDGRPGPSTTAGAGAAAGPQGYHYCYPAAEVRPAVIVSGAPTTCQLEDMVGLHEHDVMDMADFSDLFYVGASERSAAGCYGGFPY